MNYGKTTEHCLVIVIACDLFDFLGGMLIALITVEPRRETAMNSRKSPMNIYEWFICGPSFDTPTLSFSFLFSVFLRKFPFGGQLFMRRPRSQKIVFTATSRSMHIQKRGRNFTWYIFKLKNDQWMGSRTVPLLCAKQRNMILQKIYINKNFHRW